MVQATRGTRDILPSEIDYWQYIESVASRILERAAYKEIRCPIFEDTSLFQRGIGESTDVVGKEMYTFSNRGGRSLTLRPEGTAGVVRAYIEHNLQSQGGVQRLWYKGPMFRYERPQAGRQRQFHQLGVEVLGSSNPRADAEVILLATEILQDLGLRDLRLSINSVGDGADRLQYREALINYLEPYQSELDADSQQRLIRNPLRILDSKDKRTQEIVAGAPRLLDYLSSNSRQHFDQLQSLLAELGINYDIDMRLVRGLDYYTHTAFEIQSDSLGAQATVCGGGRYDGLVSQLGGPNTPAVGWAIGIERLALLVQEQTIASKPLDFYIVSRGVLAESRALVLSRQLRQAGYNVELDLSGSSFKKQLARASAKRATHCVVIGDEEVQEDTVQLKWMDSGEQARLTSEELMIFYGQQSELNKAKR